MKCRVLNCNSTDHGLGKINFFCFPKEPLRRAIWINACGGPKALVNIQNGKIE